MEATAVGFERVSMAYGLVAEIRRRASGGLWPVLRVGHLAGSTVVIIPTELWDRGWVEDLALRYGGRVLAHRIAAEAMLAGAGAIHVDGPTSLRPVIHSLIESAVAADRRIRMSTTSAATATALLARVAERLASREPHLTLVADLEPRSDQAIPTTIWRVERASVA